MKPSAIIHETETERSTRLRRKEDTDHLLQEVEGKERPRWDNVMKMLSWFFALYDRMESVPAMDPSRDIVQGVKVDRDERISWVAKVKSLLEALNKRQGNPKGVFLIWLHFRTPRVIGYVTRHGMKVPNSTGASVPVWELYREPGVGLSQRMAREEFWRAMSVLEEFAYARGWLQARLARKERADRVYRREQTTEGA